MSAIQKIFNLAKDTDKGASKYTITVQGREATQFRYLNAIMVFITVLVNLNHYFTKGVNIQCYHVVGDCDKEENPEECIEEGIDQGSIKESQLNRTGTCSKSPMPANSVLMCTNDITLEYYEWFPYFMMVLTMIMFIIAQFEVSRYKQKEEKFLKLVNDHFDPYEKGALDQFHRILRNNVLKHQQTARDHLNFFAGEATLFKTDFIRYVLGCVAACLTTLVYLVMGGYYLVEYFLDKCHTCPHVYPIAVCRLTHLKAYAFASLVMAFLNLLYIILAIQYWRRLSGREVMIEMKTLGGDKFQRSGALLKRSIKNALKSDKHLVVTSKTKKSNNVHVEIGHMLKKLYFANDLDVSVYSLAKFYPDFEQHWKSTGVEIKEITSEKKGKKGIQVQWKNAPVFVANTIMHCPRYVVYLYEPTKLTERKDTTPTTGEESFSLSFDGLIPGTEYVVAVTTKLASYLISSSVKKMTLKPPIPRLHINEIGTDYADVEWDQLPQKFYNIVGYNLEVVDSRNQTISTAYDVQDQNLQIISETDGGRKGGSVNPGTDVEAEEAPAVEFDPLGHIPYKHRIKCLKPGKKYTIKLIAMSKSARSQTTKIVETIRA